MSTHCAIGYEMKSGYIRSIYCHSDGYPEEPGVGHTLYHYYNTYGKIKELIDLGNISSLGREIGEKHDFNKLRTDIKYYEEIDGKGWTTAYGRDRGEENIKALVSSSEISFMGKYDAEYYYLWKDSQWYVKSPYKKNKKFRPLGEVLGVSKEEPNEEPDEFENVHGEGNPFAENMLKIMKGEHLQEEQMPQNNDTAIKIQREAKKTALRLYKQVYDNLFLVSQALLEIPKEYVDSETFGAEGPFKQVYDKVKQTLDSMTKVSTPETMTPEEVFPEEESTGTPNEVGVGGEDDLQPVAIE